MITLDVNEYKTILSNRTDISHKGTLYLIDTLMIICSNENYFITMSNIEKNVYTQIANKYNANISTIKSNIVKATENMYKINYINNSHVIKYTPKIVIYDLVNKIKNCNIKEENNL